MTEPHDLHPEGVTTDPSGVTAPPPPPPSAPAAAAGVVNTTGLLRQLRGPASHVVVDVVDPGIGGATPVRQVITSVGGRPEKPSTPPAVLLSAGIVVGATVVSAGIVNMTPALAAFAFAFAVIVALRIGNRRARRTDENTRWASRTGQAFGAWEPSTPLGRRRLLVDHRGLAVVDLGAHRDPMAVLLWKQVERLILVPGSERSTDPGLVVHRTDGQVAAFTTSFGLHEIMPALDDVGLGTDIEQAMAGTATARRGPMVPLPPAPPADPWANVVPATSPSEALLAPRAAGPHAVSPADALLEPDVAPVATVPLLEPAPVPAPPVDLFAPEGGRTPASTVPLFGDAPSLLPSGEDPSGGPLTHRPRPADVPEAAAAAPSQDERPPAAAALFGPTPSAEAPMFEALAPGGAPATAAPDDPWGAPADPTAVTTPPAEARSVLPVDDDIAPSPPSRPFGAPAGAPEPPPAVAPRSAQDDLVAPIPPSRPFGAPDAPAAAAPVLPAPPAPADDLWAATPPPPPPPPAPAPATWDTAPPAPPTWDTPAPAPTTTPAPAGWDEAPGWDAPAPAPAPAATPAPAGWDAAPGWDAPVPAPPPPAPAAAREVAPGELFELMGPPSADPAPAATLDDDELGRPLDRF